MFNFVITNDNGSIDLIMCRDRQEAIETYCLIYVCPKEYVKKHCVIRKTFVKKAKGGELYGWANQIDRDIK